MRRTISRILRWLFDRTFDTIIEKHLRKNREALEMKRSQQGSLI